MMDGSDLPPGFVLEHSDDATAPATPSSAPVLYDGIAAPPGEVFKGWVDNGAGGRAPQFGPSEDVAPQPDATPVAPAQVAGTGAAADASTDLAGDLPPGFELEQPAPKPLSMLQSLGAGTRATIEGALGILDLPGKVTAALMTALGIPTESASISDELDMLGLPKPETDTDKITSAIVRGGASALPFIASGGALAAAPVSQAVGGMASGGASEEARQQGYGPVTQLAVGLGAGGATALPGIARSAARAAAPQAATDYAELAKKLDITPTPATVGGTPAAVTQMGLLNYPGSAQAVGNAVDAETAGLGAAAHRVAEQAGPVSTRQGAGAAQVRGAQAYERATASAGGALYRKRDDLMGGPSAPVSVDNARKAFGELSAQFPTSKALQGIIEHPAMRRLENALPGASAVDPDAGIMTLGEATDALSHVRYIRRTLYQKSEAAPGVIRQVRKIEQALEDDVMNAARAADQAAGRPSGPGSAEQAQVDADAYWATRKKALAGSLKKPLASRDDPMKVSAEDVYNQLRTDMLRKGGNLARLRDTFFRLPQGAKRTFSATTIDDMGRSTSGAQNDLGTNWSFDTFLTNYDLMSPQARKIVFGAEVEPQVRDIAAYAARLRDLGRSRNFSKTAINRITGGLVGTIATALWGGHPEVAIAAAATPVAAFGGAKLFLATPAMRNWTKTALRVAQTQNPAAQQQGAKFLLSRLSTIAASEPAMAAEIHALQNRLSQAMHLSSPVAAQDEKDRRQNPPQQQAGGTQDGKAANGQSGLAQIQQKYPFIAQYRPNVIITPNSKTRDLLETWPAGEEGTPDRPRPASLPIGRAGIQIYKPGKVGPEDVAAEFLHVDPKANAARTQILASLSPTQLQYLKHESLDYEDSLNQGETEKRARENAVDSAMRAFVFGQGGKMAFSGMNYSAEQKRVLGRLKHYVTHGGAN